MVLKYHSMDYLLIASEKKNVVSQWGDLAVASLTQ